MSRRHRARIQSRLRIIVLSTLITVLVSEMVLFQFASGKLAPSGISASTALPEIGAPDRLSRYSTLITSDPFSPMRQPSAKVLARLATPSVEDASALRVIAIVTSGDTRLALVELPGSGQPQRIHIGDLIGAHRVLAIGPDAITLDNNGLREDFAVPHKTALDQDPSNASVSESGAPASAPQTTTQADGEAIYKAFWETRTKDIADPAPRMLVPTRPPG